MFTCVAYSRYPPARTRGGVCACWGERQKRNETKVEIACQPVWRTPQQFIRPPPSLASGPLPALPLPLLLPLTHSPLPRVPARVAEAHLVWREGVHGGLRAHGEACVGRVAECSALHARQNGVYELRERTDGRTRPNIKIK